MMDMLLYVEQDMTKGVQRLLELNYQEYIQNLFVVRLWAWEKLIQKLLKKEQIYMEQIQMFTLLEMENG